MSLHQQIVDIAMASPEFISVVIWYFVEGPNAGRYDVETTTIVASTPTHMERRVTNDIVKSKEVMDVHMLRGITRKLRDLTKRKLWFARSEEGSPRIYEIHA